MFSSKIENNNNLALLRNSKEIVTFAYYLDSSIFLTGKSFLLYVWQKSTAKCCFENVAGIGTVSSNYILKRAKTRFV